jgi:hypothetical protein
LAFDAATALSGVPLLAESALPAKRPAGAQVSTMKLFEGAYSRINPARYNRHVDGEDRGQFALNRLNGTPVPPDPTIASRATTARPFKRKLAPPGRTGRDRPLSCERFARRRDHEGRVRVGLSRPGKAGWMAAVLATGAVQDRRGELPMWVEKRHSRFAWPMMADA